MFPVLLVCIRIVTFIRTLLVCNSYAYSCVSDPYVTRIYSYVTCMLLVCIRMHPYVTRFRMYPCGVLVKKE